MERRDTDALLKPRSVAVIGASRDASKVGHLVLKNLIAGGFPGARYAVNPKPGVILDTPAHASIGEVPGPVDLAVVAVPSGAVVQVARECGAAGVRVLAVLSAGFAETGPSGAAEERSLVAVCREHGMRLLGPNCLGVINPAVKLNASFAAPIRPMPGALPSAGSVAVLAQSGALGTAILDWSQSAGVEVGPFVSLGNKADLNEADFLPGLADDPHVRAVLGYLEAISDGDRFVETTAVLTRRKPFVLVAPGMSDAGRAAAGSHTGALSGTREALAAATERSGVLLLDALGPAFDAIRTLALCRPPKRGRVAVVTNAGGPGVITSDLLDAAGLEMAVLSDGTRRTLAKTLPPAAATGNPIDLIGDARANRYHVALSTVLKDRGVDAVVVLLTPQAMTEVDGTALAIARTVRASDKPVVSSFIGGPTVASGKRLLAEHRLPVYDTPDQAAIALAMLVRAGAVAARPVRKPPKPGRPDRTAVRLLTEARVARLEGFGGREAAALLETYGVESAEIRPAGSAEAAVAAAKAVGFPVVMKLDSPAPLHKTDLGGVKLGLTDTAAVGQAYTALMKSAKRLPAEAGIRGVAISPELSEALDVIVGGRRDPVFGPVVTFGLGGIHVEVLRAVDHALAPLTEEEADALIDRTAVGGILARGRTGYHRKGIRQAIQAVSRLLTELPTVTEIDLNPVRVYAKRAVTLDIRVMFGNDTVG